ncbi:uncharacterized protein LOC110901931 [Helianthus annuus]|uniref:uncharacterized protein LOC110901931 n=1 Tax=Helianthus annuus TaxID=4232 RepID=UPI000B8F4A81|nr:uncharacterized protein LOC110901931 [Helianthus annuus]
MTKPKSKKQALIGNFFKRKFEEINDNESSRSVDNENIQANDDVDGDASPNVDNENIQANDDVDASPNVDNDNPTTSIPTTRGIIDLNDLPSDPHDRPPITSYHPNQIELLEGEIKTGKGLNQEVSLARPGDTRWGSHHRTIISLLRLFPEVVTVLQYVKEDGDCSQQRTNAKGILSYFKKLEFVFYMHLMGDILSYTNALSKHLQQKGKDLLEAANLINGTKRALNALRQNGFEPMLEKVTSFCKKYNITMLDMSESYGNPRNRKNVITNRHHFEVDIFNEVLDMQIQELGSRFSKVTTTLIKNMSGLNPSNGFSKFDPSKILAFAKMYPDDFTTQEIGTLLGDIESFRHTISDDDNFDNLNGISDLARLMVETRISTNT